MKPGEIFKLTEAGKAVLATGVKDDIIFVASPMVKNSIYASKFKVTKDGTNFYEVWLKNDEFIRPMNDGQLDGRLLGDDLVDQVNARLIHAYNKHGFGLLNSHHEALGVAYEEMEEWKETIFKDKSIKDKTEETLDVIVTMVRYYNELLRLKV